MDVFYINPIYFLIASNAVLLFAASLAILRFERMIRRYRSFWASPAGSSMQEQTEPYAVLSGFLDHRLSLLQDRIDDLARQNAPAAVVKPAELPFEHAVRMAKHGANVEDLTRSCGLKKSEAQLMQRLHAQCDAQTSRH